MKFLSLFPFLLVAWALLIFTYQSYMDGAVGDIIFYLVLAGIAIYWGIKRYRKNSHNTSDSAKLIALAIGLLPLLYANLILMPIILAGEKINESGMVYVLVMIYSPIMYIGSLVVLMLYFKLKKK